LACHAATTRYVNLASFQQKVLESAAEAANHEHIFVGRNLSQCMNAASQLFDTPMKVPSLKRKSISGPPDQPAKRLAIGSPFEPAGQPAAGTSVTPPAISAPLSVTPTTAAAALPSPMHINIQPRPTQHTNINGHPLAPIQTQPQAAPTARRRGRPSRADKSRQLRPILPQHLTPLAPRTSIASAGTPTQETSSPLTPTLSYRASPDTIGTPKTGKKRGRPPLGEKAQPASPPS
jgi:hypothetical protein